MYIYIDIYIYIYIHIHKIFQNKKQESKPLKYKK